MNNPTETAAALRALADIIEKMPDSSRWHCNAHCWPDEPDEFRAIAAVMGAFKKGGDAYYEISREISDSVKMSAHIARGKICKKVRVVKEVEEYQCDDSLLDPLATESEVPA